MYSLLLLLYSHPLFIRSSSSSSFSSKKIHLLSLRRPDQRNIIPWSFYYPLLYIYSSLAFLIKIVNKTETHNVSTLYSFTFNVPYGQSSVSSFPFQSCFLMSPGYLCYVDNFPALGRLHYWLKSRHGH